jgi:hypothetical protein
MLQMFMQYEKVAIAEINVIEYQKLYKQNDVASWKTKNFSKVHNITKMVYTNLFSDSDRSIIVSVNRWS